MKVSILTFGSCGWDEIIDSKTKQLIYEEEGKKNSHQAVAALRGGANSILISFVGNDEIGKRVLKSLKECGLNTSYIKIIEGQSTEHNIELYDTITKDYELIRGPIAISQKYNLDTVKQYETEILKASAVNLVAKQPKDFLTAVINYCYKNGITTYLTISHKKYDIYNTQDFEILKKVSFLAGNLKECRELTELENPAKMLKLLPNMLITDGGNGVWFCDENLNVCHEEAVHYGEVVETNGAGDTFIGNFMVYKAEGKSITECVRRAMCASAIEISKMGVYSSMPYRDETDCLYNEYYIKNKGTK